MTKKFKRSETALIMALPLESQGLFEKEGVSIYYSGVGKINATMRIMDVFAKKRPQQVINLGTAGSHKLSVGTIVECSGYLQRDMDLSLAGFPVGQTPGETLKDGFISGTALSNYTKGVCGSGDRLERGVPLIDCDLMDMEAFALAKVCMAKQVPFYSFKFITDQSDQNINKDWKAALQGSAQALLGIYREFTTGDI